ncbi:MAG: hypothetical protein WBA67_06310 [Jannaschia sp.]
MGLVSDVAARLKAEVPALGGRVEGARELSELMRSGQLPEAAVSANVLPLGLRGRRADAATGAFTQIVGRTISVLITMRTYGADFDRTEATVEDLIAAVCEAICGWAPDDQVGVFELLRGDLVGMRAGTLIYQIDFTINDQLRIIG